MSLPQSPNDMPSELRIDAREIRNMVVSLDQYSCVDIHWECDHRVSEACGENVGEWEVLIEDGPRQIRSKHRDITNALWFVTTLADADSIAAYQAQQEARAAALAKLTTAEKKILGIF